MSDLFSISCETSLASFSRIRWSSRSLATSAERFWKSSICAGSVILPSLISSPSSRSLQQTRHVTNAPTEHAQPTQSLAREAAAASARAGGIERQRRGREALRHAAAAAALRIQRHPRGEGGVHRGRAIGRAHRGAHMFFSSR